MWDTTSGLIRREIREVVKMNVLMSGGGGREEVNSSVQSAN